MPFMKLKSIHYNWFNEQMKKHEWEFETKIYDTKNIIVTTVANTVKLKQWHSELKNKSEINLNNIFGISIQFTAWYHINNFHFYPWFNIVRMETLV